MNFMITRPLYPVSAMYAPVRDAIWEVQSQVQAPDALVAGSALTAMAVACQGNVDVLLPTGLVRPTSLYITAIGQSGERKTSIDGLFSAPIYAHDQKCALANADTMVHYEATLRMWQAEDAAMQRKLGKAVNEGADLEQYRSELISHARLQPSKPVAKRIVHQNITERPLLEALRGDGKSIAILSDEGEIVLRGGAMTKMGVLNKAWDGATSLTLDRVDDHVQATNPRVTVSLMVQEEVFQDFLTKRGRIARGSGHLARYLVAYPASTVGFRGMTLRDHAWVSLPAFHDRVTELLEMADERQASGKARTLLEFSDEAKQVWVDAQNWVEVRMRPGECFEGIKDAASKSMEIAGRLAAIFHYFNGSEGLISKEALQRALDVADWHINEFNRLFGDANRFTQLQQDANYLNQHLLNRYWQQGYQKVSWNHVRTRNGSVRDQHRFEAAMQELQRLQSLHVGQESLGRGKGKRYIYRSLHQFQPFQPQPSFQAFPPLPPALLA